MTPCRALDTRVQGQGPAFGVEDRVVAVAGKCNVPLTARAVSLNITVTQPTNAGRLTPHGDGNASPVDGMIFFSANQTRADNTVAVLSAAGDGTLRLNAAMQGQAPSVHVIVDANGYFE